MLQKPNQNILGDNPMKPEEIKKKVSESKEIIDKLSSDINALQNECRHTEYEVKNVGSDVMELKNVCKNCQLILGYPTKDELNDNGFLPE